MPAAITDKFGFTEQLVEDTPELRKYYEISLRSLQTGMDILAEPSWHTKDGWKLEHKSQPPHHTHADLVHSKNLSGIGKVFIYTGEIHATAKHLLSIVHDRCDDYPSWNAGTIAEFKKILDVGSQCSLVYNRCCDMFGGLFKSREFVQARCWREIDGSIVICGTEADYDQAPKHHGAIRGKTIIGFMKLTPMENGQKCLLTWIMYSELKGMLPKALIDRVYGYTMVEYIKNLRSHAAQGHQTC